MRGKPNVSLVLAAMLAVFGCGGDERNPPPGGGGGDGGGGNDMGVPDGGPPMDAPSNPDAPPANPTGPTVEITNIQNPAAGDFSASSIMTQNRFSVLCRVTPNATSNDPVDSSSVRIEVFGGGQSRTFTALPTATANTFRADVSISGFPNGPLAIRCTGADISSEMRANSDQVDTFYDQGPRIDIFTPAPNAGYAGQLDVLFTVIASPVAPGDQSLSSPDFNAVVLEVAGVQIASLSRVGNTFQGAVLFDDAALFPEPLAGEQTLVVRAFNGRGVVRSTQVVFRSDSQGPAITISSPALGDLVSGIVTVTADISDLSGVDATSVVATIAGAANQFELLPVAGTTFRGSFDTRLLPGGQGFNIVFPNIVVRARDTLGNQSSFGFIVTLDNTSPRISLDPPAIREGRPKGAGVECSLLFDPVGDDAANDLDHVPQLSKVRAWVEDRSNGASSSPGVVIPQAGINDLTVELFILDDESNNTALLVDRTDDPDDVCDDINPLLIPTSIPAASNEVALIQLAPLEPEGTAHFNPPDPSAPVPVLPYNPNQAYSLNGPDSACLSPPASPEPATLCFQSPATRILFAELAINTPVIYGIPPATDLQCFGFAFDFVGTNISEGWACVAVRAEDNLGNVAVSPPLRLCFDDFVPSNGTPNCSPAIAPDCRGTFNPATNQLDAANNCRIDTLQNLFTPAEIRRRP